MARVLICVGFGKCGTTYLYSLLRQNSRFHVSPRQELRYFMGDATRSREDYLSRFIRDPRAEGEENGTVIAETSPQYLTKFDLKGTTQVLRRIKATVPDAQFLVCLRHPVARAFSRYLHLLDVFARYGTRPAKAMSKPKALFRSLYDFSFEKALAETPTVNVTYAESLALLFDLFGPARVLIFSMEDELKRFPEFYARLCDFLELEDDRFYERGDIYSVAQRNAHQGAPVFAYGGAQGRVTPDGLQLEPRQFLACTSRGLHRIDGVLPKQAKLALAAREEWTLSLTAEASSAIFERWFKDDAVALREMLLERAPGQPAPDYVAAPPYTKVVSDWTPTEQDIAATGNEPPAPAAAAG